MSHGNTHRRVCIVLVASALSLQAQDQQIRSAVSFDVQGTGHPILRGSIPFEIDGKNSSGAGIAWRKKPNAAFIRTSLSRSRDDGSIDGVTGKELAFTADVANGSWWITLWIEAGTEDSSTMEFVVQGHPVSHAWHPFVTPAEPRIELRRVVRVFTTRAVVDGSGLDITMRSNRDSVRILNIGLIPDHRPSDAWRCTILDSLTAIGKYGATRPLDGISEVLQQSSDPTSAFWRQEVDLLKRAERLYEMRGWEWATRQLGIGIWDRYQQAVMYLDAILNRPDATGSPLYERALFLRARFLYWLGLEQGGRNEIAAASRDFAILARRHPEDQLIAMYSGEQIPIPGACDTLAFHAEAPVWSRLQAEALCRLREEIHWWVNVRQAPNGEFGGKLGDDVELLRGWSPILLLGDATAVKGWKRLADEVWNSHEVHDGYSRSAIDVEHASEFIADTAPELAVFLDDKEYVKRLSASARHFGNHWTAINPSGRRFFRSAWFSSTEVDDRPPRNRDLEMNTRATKAVRYYAWKTGDSRATQLLYEWSKAWAEVSMRSSKGKPAGIVPPSVRFTDESINGDEPSWTTTNMYWDYFEWDHSRGSMMLDQLYFTSTITGDTTLLAPMFASLELIRLLDQTRGEDESVTGSPRWAARQLSGDPAFWSTVEEWRSRSGVPGYDDLIIRYGTPYARTRITDDESYVVSALNDFLSTLRVNRPLRTTEVMCTDRVRLGSGANLLKAMLTGSGVHEGMSPYLGVSWESTESGFTALVRLNTDERLTVDVFDHSMSALPVVLRTWQLKPGWYRLRVLDGSTTVNERRMEVKHRGTRWTVPLTPGRLLTLTIEPAS